jgi:hypothetical protein
VFANVGLARYEYLVFGVFPVVVVVVVVVVVLTIGD